MKSQKLREKIKKITPAFFHVGLFAVAVSAAYLAKNYHDRLEYWEGDDGTGSLWLLVPGAIVKGLKDGRTMMYREMETSSGEIRNQMTTLDDWSEEANERFANYK